MMNRQKRLTYSIHSYYDFIYFNLISHHSQFATLVAILYHAMHLLYKKQQNRTINSNNVAHAIIFYRFSNYKLKGQSTMTMQHVFFIIIILNNLEFLFAAHVNKVM